MCYIYYNQDFSKYLLSNFTNLNDSYQNISEYEYENESNLPLFINPNVDEDELNEEFERELNLNTDSVNRDSEDESDNELYEMDEDDQHFRIVSAIETDNFDLFVSYINREFAYVATELAKVIYNLTPGNLHENKYFNHLQFDPMHEFLIGCIYEYATSLLTSTS